MLPPCMSINLLHERQTDAQSTADLFRRVELHKHPEDLRQLSGLDTDAGITHTIVSSLPVCVATNEICPPGRLYFAALLSRFENTWANRTR